MAAPKAQAWECPRCRAVNAPHVTQCACPAPTGLSERVQVARRPASGTVDLNEILAPRPKIFSAHRSTQKIA